MRRVQDPLPFVGPVLGAIRECPLRLVATRSEPQGILGFRLRSRQRLRPGRAWFPLRVLPTCPPLTH